jgi:hypothetical protein
MQLVPSSIIMPVLLLDIGPTDDVAVALLDAAVAPPAPVAGVSSLLLPQPQPHAKPDPKIKIPKFLMAISFE